MHGWGERGDFWEFFNAAEKRNWSQSPTSLGKGSIGIFSVLKQFADQFVYNKMDDSFDNLDFVASNVKWPVTIDKESDLNNQSEHLYAGILILFVGFALSDEMKKVI